MAEQQKKKVHRLTPQARARRSTREIQRRQGRTEELRYARPLLIFLQQKYPEIINEFQTFYDDIMGRNPKAYDIMRCKEFKYWLNGTPEEPKSTTRKGRPPLSTTRKGRASSHTPLSGAAAPSLSATRKGRAASHTPLSGEAAAAPSLSATRKGRSLYTPLLNELLGLEGVLDEIETAGDSKAASYMEVEAAVDSNAVSHMEVETVGDNEAVSACIEEALASNRIDADIDEALRIMDVAVREYIVQGDEAANVVHENVDEGIELDPFEEIIDDIEPFNFQREVEEGFNMELFEGDLANINEIDFAPYL